MQTERTYPSLWSKHDACHQDCQSSKNFTGINRDCPEEDNCSTLCLLIEGALVLQASRLEAPSEVATGGASGDDAFPDRAHKKSQHQNVKKMGKVFRQLELAVTRSTALSLTEV